MIEEISTESTFATGCVFMILGGLVLILAIAIMCVADDNDWFHFILAVLVCTLSIVVGIKWMSDKESILVRVDKSVTVEQILDKYDSAKYDDKYDIWRCTKKDEKE